MLIQISQRQIHLITLWYLVQHSLSSFYKLYTHYAELEHAYQPDQVPTWQALGLHKSHIQRLIKFQLPEEQNKFQKIILYIQQQCDFLISIEDADYPHQLTPYADRPPLLMGQGQASALLQAQIAIVGSRKPSPTGQKTAYDFAYYLAEKGFYINSGLAQGIDEAAHQGGLMHQRTIAVMGTGLDQTYPSQHQHLREKILHAQGAVITEFLPQTPPLQHHFPRRNRIVSALSLGVIVAEAALKSGSLITAKLAAEQGKVVFAIPGHIYSEFHQGCHQLIRDGAILVDHPEQVIEDLALPTQWQHLAQIQAQAVSPPTTEIPAHLISLYNQIDWVGQSLDQLTLKTSITVAELTAQLMELELLGLVLQQAGCYQRCRPNK